MSNDLKTIFPLDIDSIQWNEHGLVPAIIQDNRTHQVLMLAWMNADSLRLTLKSRQAWFWSRSRRELWHKGATSGNTQQVVSLAFDCDADALLVRVHPAGPACHTGNVTCFYRDLVGRDLLGRDLLPPGD